MDDRATYSPEDNKIRFYPAARLPKELYQRVRAAGFIWAPKQDLFVAPMWTPEREDLMLELCGEIGDEDTSLVDRAEQRSDRFQDYSANRKQDADAAHKAVSAIADNIPLGQPILVGHHSERRARRDAEKIQNGMAKAVKMWEQSKYWKERAAGAIRHAKYKERPDVRARRIKKIEADKRRSERSKAAANACLKLWLNCPDLVKAKSIAGYSEAGWLPTAKHPTLDQFLHPGDVLPFPDREEYAKANYPTWTLDQVKERARECYGRSMANSDRWIAHYENRLTYERAMLEEPEPEKPQPKAPLIESGEQAEEAFAQMKQSLKAGVQVVTANQLFPTPAQLSEMMADLADLTAGEKLLEPSAGTGQLIRVATRRGIFKSDITAVELRTELAPHLRTITGSLVIGDFLEIQPGEWIFDKILMNPPFQNGSDIAHIMHALKFLDEGGRLVAICANGPRQQEQLKPLSWHWVDLGPGIFPGTNVNTALFSIDK